MTPIRFLLRSLRFHLRSNIALALGIVAGAAVLTGAPIVGDSQRGSLRERGERQLAGVRHLLVSPRFFSQTAAGDPATRAHPAIVLRGSAVRDADGGELRAGKVDVYGVGDDFPILRLTYLKTGQTALSSALAARLGARVGDTVRVNLERQSDIPRASAFGRRKASETTRSLFLEVAFVLSPDHPASQFAPTPSTAAPLNLWMPLADLQKELRGRGEVGDSIDALFAFGGSRDEWQADLDRGLQIEDWGLKTAIRGRGENRYLSVESSRLLLEFPLEDAVLRTAADLAVPAAATTVYLVNRMNPGPYPVPPAVVTGAAVGWAARIAEVPWFVVAALDTDRPAPLGPFYSAPLADDEILLVDLPGKAFDTEPGKFVTLHYYRPESEAAVRPSAFRFKVRDRIPLSGVADDRGLTPAFPGITDRLTISDWDPPFPYEPSWVSKVDDAFWTAKGATPKAYISRSAGERLFGSRFGKTTSIRIAIPADTDPKAFQQTFRKALRAHLDPEKSGFAFDPIGERLRASRDGSVDFGALFIGFSSFLIASALLLIGLLQKLRIQQRARELGLLLATGWSPVRVRRMLLVEGLFVAVPAAAVGSAIAVLYAGGMLALLADLWPDKSTGTFLTLHVEPLTLVFGFLASVAASLLAILLAVASLKKQSAVALLHGGTEAASPAGRKPAKWPTWAFAGGIVAAVVAAVAGPYLPPGEARAGAFFTSGIVLLSLSMLGLWLYLRRDRREAIRPGPKALSKLALRNASRHPGRSLLTAGLLATAAFLLIAVESFRRSPDGEFRRFSGGSGGFALIATTDLPIHFDMASVEGRDEILDGWMASRQRLGESPAEAERAELGRNLAGNKYFPLQLRDGDDASCLNLYKATRPRVLGVPPGLCYRGGFRFSATSASTAPELENPWLLLMATRGADEPIPVFVEENTATWQLKVGLGDTLPIVDGAGTQRVGRIAGTLKDSIFQSELIVGERDFRELFPHREGFGAILMEVPPDRIDPTRKAMTAGLSAYGADVRSTSDVVAEYLAVQNAYLSLFQVLGALGLLLGAFGLAVVMLRNVWERRAELALLRATGWSKGRLAALVFRENAALLTLGLIAGVPTALISVAPHLAMGGGLPVVEILVPIGVLLGAGLLTGLPAMRQTLRTPLLTALRHE